MEWEKFRLALYSAGTQQPLHRSIPRMPCENNKNLEIKEWRTRCRAKSEPLRYAWIRMCHSFELAKKCEEESNCALQRRSGVIHVKHSSRKRHHFIDNSVFHWGNHWQVSPVAVDSLFYILCNRTTLMLSRPHVLRYISPFLDCFSELPLRRNNC